MWTRTCHLFVMHSVCRRGGRQFTRRTTKGRFALSTSSSHYDVLGISKASSQHAIKTRYIELARTYHPDISKQTNAEIRFKEISAAYDTLGCPRKRAAYDSKELYESQVYGSSSSTYSAPRPYPSSHPSMNKARSSPPFRVLLHRLGQGSAIAWFGFLMPVAGLLVLCFGSLRDTSQIEARDRPVPLCFNRRSGKWEEYDFFTMHRHRETQVRYVPRKDVARVMRGEKTIEAPANGPAISIRSDMRRKRKRDKGHRARGKAKTGEGGGGGLGK